MYTITAPVLSEKILVPPSKLFVLLSSGELTNQWQKMLKEYGSETPGPSINRKPLQLSQTPEQETESFIPSENTFLFYDYNTHKVKHKKHLQRSRKWCIKGLFSKRLNIES